MENIDKNNYVIVIGRQFGCGAREIGKLISKELEIPYYDKELLQEASKSSGVSAEIFEASDERSPNLSSSLWSFNAGFGSASYLIGTNILNNDNIYKAQSDVIKEIAKQRPCVIVGRTADFILRDEVNVISVFIHATLDDRINRIIDRGDCENADEARTLAIKSNKLRAGYYNFYAEGKWGDAATYDLSINSSHLGTKATAAMIIDYVKRRLGKL